jgi:hypothetical protein
MKVFISRRVYQTAIASVKLPIALGSTRDSRVGERVLAIANFFLNCIAAMASPARIVHVSGPIRVGGHCESVTRKLEV